MEIKNLAQLKRAIEAKTPFTIIQHFNRPEYTGQVRVPKTIQTNGFYSAIYNEPDHPLSNANYGKGVWLSYGKASNWEFCNGRCLLFNIYNGKKYPVWVIQFAD